MFRTALESNGAEVGRWWLVAGLDGAQGEEDFFEPAEEVVELFVGVRHRDEPAGHHWAVRAVWATGCGGRSRSAPTSLRGQRSFDWLKGRQPTW